MGLEFVVRIGRSGCFIEATIEVLGQENIQPNQRGRDIDEVGNLLVRGHEWLSLRGYRLAHTDFTAAMTRS